MEAHPRRNLVDREWEDAGDVFDRVVVLEQRDEEWPRVRAERAQVRPGAASPFRVGQPSVAGHGSVGDGGGGGADAE